MKRLLGTIYYTIFYLCIFFLIISGIIAYTARFTVPGGFRIYSVLTGSMNPTVPTGSLIINKIPTSVSDISQGKIITFIEPGYRNKYITHRVYNVVNQGKVTLFQTKGDANKSPDSWRIAYGAIKGVYQISFPTLGFFLEFLKSPIGIVIFVFLPLSIIAFSEVRNIFNILLDMRLEKERVKQEHSSSSKNYVVVLSFFLALSLLLLSSTSSFALFRSNTVSISRSTITTAQSFPTPSPTPTPRITATPTPTPRPICDGDHDADDINCVTPTPTTLPICDKIAVLLHNPHCVTPTPTLSPTPRPTATPTPLPICDGDHDLDDINCITPTPTIKPGCGGGTIIITGNGAGSQNGINVTNNCKSTTSSSSNSTSSTTITSITNTGGNISNGNTNSSTTINNGSTHSTSSGQASITIDVTNNSDANSATPKVILSNNSSSNSGILK